MNLKELGLEAVGILPENGWRWMEGMKSLVDCDGDTFRCIRERVGREAPLFINLESRKVIPVPEGILRPDFSDPATLGCLSQLVIELWTPKSKFETASITLNEEPLVPMTTVSIENGYLYEGHAESLAEALVDALKEGSIQD